ncbi:mobilization protein [Thiomonas intermedia]|uniref:mobilization protein n=1 Tax=Thiomonas intermedia TaxID=926 RepID=UPI0009A4C651|nr:mobilization protein [Thiomonas intermedia]
MRWIHLIGGEKGGVGKSLMARLLAQYCIDHGLPFVGFDSDRSHGALLRFYADYTSPVVVDRYESLDGLVEAALAEPERRVLVDLAAQTQAALERWMEDSGLLDLAPELGLQIRYWHVMDSGRDSVDLLRTLLDRFGARLDIVLVLNQLRGDDFGILEQSGQKQRALDLGARIMPLRRLHEAAMIKIDAASSSFWAATHSAVVHDMGLLERQRVKTWLRNAYQELDALGI